LNKNIKFNKNIAITRCLFTKLYLHFRVATGSAMEMASCFWHCCRSGSWCCRSRSASDRGAAMDTWMKLGWLLHICSWVCRGGSWLMRNEAAAVFGCGCWWQREKKVSAVQCCSRSLQWFGDDGSRHQWLMVVTRTNGIKMELFSAAHGGYVVGVMVVV